MAAPPKSSTSAPGRLADRFASTFKTSIDGKTVCRVEQTNIVAIGRYPIEANTPLDRNKDGQIQESDLKFRYPILPKDVKPIVDKMTDTTTETWRYIWSEESASFTGP